MTRPEAIAIEREQIADAYSNGAGIAPAPVVVEALQRELVGRSPSDRMIAAFLAGAAEASAPAFVRSIDQRAMAAVEGAR